MYSKVYIRDLNLYENHSGYLITQFNIASELDEQENTSCIMIGKTEQTFYKIVWVSAIFYSLWKFVQSSRIYLHLYLFDLEDGGYLPWMKDASDFEWKVMSVLFKKHWMLLVFQIFCSQFVFKSWNNVLPIFYSFYSVLCLASIFGAIAAFILVLFVLVMYILHLSGSKILCYSFTVLSLLVSINWTIKLKEFFVYGEIELELFILAFGWLVAKSLSFAVDRIDAGVNQLITMQDFSIVFSYCFYLPSVFAGPIMSYEPFVKQVFRTQQPFSSKVFVGKILNFVYYLTWYFILDLLMHIVYSSGIQYYPRVVSEFDSWSVFGLGYALPLMFFLKYYVFYGMAGSIAKFENFNFPPPPKCISCVHLSSCLWRHFDRGLYLWILRYIYFPVVSSHWTSLRKIYALALSFTFVCLWHGMEKPICAWSFLNFLLVTSEYIVKYLLSTKIGEYFQAFSAGSQRRLSALLAVPHFILMCISCTFFLSNWDIGMLISERVMCTGVIPLFPLMFVMYCGCHVAMDAQHYQQSHKTSS